MTAALVFKTTDQACLDAYAQHLELEERDVASRKALMDEWNEAYPRHKDGSDRAYFILTLWSGACYFTGMEVLPGEWSEPPLGWRVDKSKKTLVPRLKSPEGQAIQARMNAVTSHAYRQDLETATGMPREGRPPRDETRSESFIYFPNYRLVDGVLYAEWASPDVYDDVIKKLGSNQAGWAEVTRADYAAVTTDKQSDAA